MTLFQLGLTLATVIALSAGQILFKIAAESLTFSLAHIWQAATNIKLIVALCVYFVATVMWLYVLKTTPLRVAYPFIALAFAIVPILSNLFLNEPVHWNTFLGALLIGVGVWVSVYR